MVIAERGGQAARAGLLDFENGDEDDLQGYYLASRTRNFLHVTALCRGFRV